MIKEIFKDASDDSKEIKNELKDLPYEVVDKDGADKLPSEVSISGHNENDSHMTWQEAKNTTDGKIHGRYPMESPRTTSNLSVSNIGLGNINEKRLDNSDKKVENKDQNDIQENKDAAEEKKDGLTDNQKKELKERTGWPDEIIESIGSMEEAKIYEDAGLQAVEVDGKWCLVRSDIDLDQKDEDGISNKERMERGRPPLTKDGKEVELHHIGQKQDSPLAELTMEEHRGAGNDTILHDKTKESEIDRTAFAKERKDHWKSRVDS